MKILEVCPYSAGICGVWARAEEESRRLIGLGHEVMVFSSNKTKGSDEVAKANQKIGKLEIQRFKSVKLGGESFIYFNYEKEAIAYRPDVITAHNYRHLHTLIALRVANKLRKLGHKCKVVLVTHAPFVEGNITRKGYESLIVSIYDSIIGRLTLPHFDAILPISKWEIPYLINIGAKKEKIKYVPNGIPPEFLTVKKAKEKKHILFLGRISPKKKLETLIKAMALINKKIKLVVNIVGPQEKEYFQKLQALVNSLDANKYVRFMPPVSGLRAKIKVLDEAIIFVLPSRVEGMPQALIEAMAREKVVIGSNSIAIRDIIHDSHNGYLFEFDNLYSLAEAIEKAISKPSAKIKKEAKKCIESFSWNKVIILLDKVLKEVYSKK